MSVRIKRLQANTKYSGIDRFVNASANPQFWGSWLISLQKHTIMVFEWFLLTPLVPLSLSLGLSVCLSLSLFLPVALPVST
mmetsp:Transcript_789/g.1279  ORF Transcript_789/g.1279 Transcript_789/m.1279 type:complete len:81 (+) Transcript_789:231-473(+)